MKEQKLVVCIDPHPKASLLLRTALNKSKELKLPLVCLYIETPEYYALDRKDRERMMRTMTRAEDFGAEICRIQSGDALSGILSYTLEATDSIHTIILGKTAKEGFFAELKASLAERLMRALNKEDVAVQVVPLTSKHYAPSWFDRLRVSHLRLKDMAFAMAAVGCAYLLSEFLRDNVTTAEWFLHSRNISAFFIIATVITSLRAGLLPSLLTAIMSIGIINYFYTKPIGQFALYSSADKLAVIVFLLSAVAVSILGAYSRASNIAMLRRERRSQALYRVHRIASEATERKQALEMMHEELSELLEMPVAFFMPNSKNHEEVMQTYPNKNQLRENDIEALEKCWVDMRTTGIGTLSRFKSSWRFEPMITSSSEIGVIAVNVPDHVKLDTSFGRLMSALADQAAAILERIELTKMMSDSRMGEEREKLRAMLLSSVSHDLKTPLASIIGSMSVYKRMLKSGRLTDEVAKELTETALDEAQRLDSFISNILDMTRIESGEIEFKKEWVVHDEPLNAVFKRLKQRLKNHIFTVKELDVDYEVQMDQMMTEQVFQNVLDNAAKYSPEGTEITVSFEVRESGFCYVIQDNGEGIPQDKLEAVFDKYERLKHKDTQVAGTGLGLAIGRAIMGKQAGTLVAGNRKNGGAEFTLCFEHYRLKEQHQLSKGA